MFVTAFASFWFKLFLQNSSNWNPDLIRVNQSDTTPPGYNQRAWILSMPFLQIQFLCCFCYYFCELADFGHGYFWKVYYFGGVVTFGQEKCYRCKMLVQVSSLFKRKHENVKKKKKTFVKTVTSKTCHWSFMLLPQRWTLYVYVVVKN